MWSSNNLNLTNLPVKPWSSPSSFRTSGPSFQIARVEPDRISVTDVVHGAPDDDELIALVRQGEIDAFDKLIQRHRGMCLKRAWRILRNLSAAEDAVQSACQNAFRHLEQFQAKGTFQAWLARIVENQCLMQIRQEGNTRFVYLDNTTESNRQPELVSRTISPEDELGWKELQGVLRTEILRLPPLFRNIMVLHDSEQLPIPDVAQRLGLSVTAAKSRLLRARRELRCRIGKHCGRKGYGTLLEQGANGRAAGAGAN